MDQQNEHNGEMQVQDDAVVSMGYTLRADDAEGEVLDSSEGREPLQFMQGRGQIIPGLERELYGMQVEEVPSLVAWLAGQGVRIYSVTPRRLSLEEVFMRVMAGEEAG